MSLIESLGLRALHCFDPEKAHGLALKALRAGLAGGSGAITSDRLKVRIAGIDFPNPVGASAGFDKNATALAPLAKAGFGFIEVGAATPRPQPGNPKPRLFRLTEDRAAINRFGFNNDGMDAIAARLAARPTVAAVGAPSGPPPSVSRLPVSATDPAARRRAISGAPRSAASTVPKCSRRRKKVTGPIFSLRIKRSQSSCLLQKANNTIQSTSTIYNNNSTSLYPIMASAARPSQQ